MHKPRQTPPARCLHCPLRALPAFSLAADATMRRIKAHRVGTRHYRNGEAIFRVDDPVREAYTLFEGHAITYRLLNGGERQVLRFLLPGDLLFTVREGETTWTETAQAVGHAVACVLSAEGLRALFGHDLYVAQAIALIHDHEESLLEEHIADMGRRPAIDRVVRLLLELFHRKWQRGRTDGTGCPLPFTQEQIGDAVGLTNVYVSRVLVRLRARGVLSLTQGRLDIPDFAATASAFDYQPSYLSARPLI